MAGNYGPKAPQAASRLAETGVFDARLDAAAEAVQLTRRARRKPEAEQVFAGVQDRSLDDAQAALNGLVASAFL